ncbi:MAG TPA: efflux transporter outer membrane subunit [Bryobacteraceae bacterium]|nr:efflux transporter outer membrane subunit [Bryobacteraceae bacterium]
MKPVAASVCAAAAALLMAACLKVPNYSKPAAFTAPADNGQLPAQYTESNGWKQAQPAGQSLPEDWWKIFGIAELDALEAQMDVSNQSIQAADAQFRQARALVAEVRAGLSPTLSTNPSISTNRNSHTTPFSSQTVGEYSNLELPFDLSYELDAWGRIHRSVAAARAGMQASAADLAAVRLSMHAEMALDYFELRSLDAQKRLLESTLTAYQKALDVNQNRFDGGLASGADVAQARTQVESTRAQSVDVDEARAQYEHAIAALAGRSPESFHLERNPLEATPPPVPTGIPSQLLERRPDIAAAERRMAAANQQIGIAQAAFYPILQITAAGGFQSGSIVDWFNWPSRFWALGPSAFETLFDAGRRRAAAQAAQAAYDEAVANYRQAAIDAFREVEDSLSALRVLETEAGAQRVAVEAAERSLALSNNRYQGGLVTYLEVVVTQSTALANERVEVDLQRRRMEACVLLIKALGGGWNVSQLPS